ncbi:MAG: hypothetical protein WD077_02280 [Bacteroidia bacterium]
MHLSDSIILPLPIDSFIISKFNCGAAAGVVKEPRSASDVRLWKMYRS